MIREHKSVIECIQFGSRVVPGASRKDSDYDWLCITDDLEALKDEIKADGYRADVKAAQYKGDFTSYRKGPINLCITDDRLIFEATRTAVRISRELELYKRFDRVGLYEIVRVAMRDKAAREYAATMEAKGIEDRARFMQLAEKRKNEDSKRVISELLSLGAILLVGTIVVILLIGSASI